MRPGFPIGILGGALAALALGPLGRGAGPPDDGPLPAAQRLLQTGKYAEAEDAFRALPAEDAVAAALGLARCHEAVGKREQAVTALVEAGQRHPDAAALPAERARLALAAGDHKAAEEASAAALKLDKDQALALLVRAELACAAGRLADANAGYERLVKLFNSGEVHDSASLRWIGLGAAQFARWNRLSDQFKFLVNEFYPDLLSNDPTCWQAHYEAGRLFAEKYNTAEAAKELKAALALNANAAEVHVALGYLSLDEFELAAAQAACARALEINPQLLAAWHLKADIQLANFEPRQCAAVLADAVKLHPLSEETLGRLAAAYASVDGLKRTTPESRFGKLVMEVTARNPHAGVFFKTLADALDRLRRWPAAAQYYQEAMKRMPQLVAPAGQLGMMLMRLGEEERAKTVLDEAFKNDPFNVRVNNTLKVLEVLDRYETFETEHFRIKYDPAKDKVLARYMGRWLEEVYPQLVRQMAFAPPEKSLFEVFSSARNTDGHGWFSARMVGLPHIHPIGACAGKIVALQSPSEGEQRFNWSRVLKHEFVHVINLQQTDFNIPHWFTEALAVLNEGYPPPQSWNDLLAASVAKNKLFDLESINLGFIRPHSSDEWTLAYCQAELYAQYMLERFGEDAIAKMLSAYADNLTTPEAIERSFHVAPHEFEQGYRAFVGRALAAAPAAPAAREPTLGEAQKALAADPKNPQLMARLAYAQLGRKNYADARRWADAALAAQPSCALANYVRARLHLLVGENREALVRLEGALDRDNPQENLLALLAGLKMKAEDYPAAIELYQLGARHDPRNAKWQKALAAVYLKSRRDRELAEVLVSLADADPDDFAIRKKLAQLARARGDWPATARWTLEGLHIQVVDGELHEWRAEALAAQGDLAATAEEYAVAVELDPNAPKLRMALAQTYVKAQETAKAKSTLAELLQRNPDYPGARELAESLK